LFFFLALLLTAVWTILQTLEKYNNNMSQVAVALGISRAALYRRLEKYNIQVND
jgi:transcriptional regulator of acetoin/glycerol metabolism